MLNKEHYEIMHINGASMTPSIDRHKEYLIILVCAYVLSGVQKLAQQRKGKARAVVYTHECINECM
mgnify:CR=1 FL=1